MKLHELDTLNQQGKAAQVLEQRLGQTVSFSNLSLRESRHMLLRVRSLINEHRSSAASHSSERDPAYLKLLMLESGLKGRLKEVAPAVPGQPAAGAVPIDTKDPKVQAAMKKSQSGQTLNPEEQKLIGAVAASAMQKESLQARRRLRESEIQQAQVVLAAQDMVDQVQKMLEQISAMQFKDLPALTDSIKNDMGVDQATAYQSAAAASLTQLLQSVQTGKTALEGAQATLTGQAPVVPGEEPAADMGADLNAEPAADMGAELNVDAEVAPAGDEEEPTPLGAPEALGRERRGAGGMMEGTHTRTNTYRINGQDMIEYLANETGAQVEMRGDDVGILTVDTITFPRLAKLAADLAQQGKIKAIAGPATRDMTGRAVPVGGNYMSGPSRRDIGEAAKKKGKKPDFLDVDKDGNKKEPFKKAVADKKKNPFAKKK
jgi:hypothetical protein